MATPQDHLPYITHLLHLSSNSGLYYEMSLNPQDHQLTTHSLHPQLVLKNLQSSTIPCIYLSIFHSILPIKKK